MSFFDIFCRATNRLRVRKHTQLLINAAEAGNHSEVLRLIPLSDPAYNNSVALAMAARFGHSACVKALIPVSHPASHCSWALQLAAEHGHLRCVQLLVGVSNPNDYSTALKLAVVNGAQECVDVLYEVSDPVWALNEILANGLEHRDGVAYLRQRIDNTVLREKLYSSVGQPYASAPKRRI